MRVPPGQGQKKIKDSERVPHSMKGENTMTIKEKISALADAHPDLLGFRGKLTYMLCEVIPENCDVSDKEMLELMDMIPDAHLEYIYNTLTNSERITT